MIRCIAVDDEAYAANIIADYISKIPFLEMVGITTSPIEAINMVQDGKVDLAFLDIQMPELTGIQFLKICGNKCKVILTTAYPDYALEGYEHDVIDYLLKPIPFDRFFKAAHKAQSIMQLQEPTALAATQPSVHMPAASAVPDYMFVKGESKNKFLKVAYSDILYVEGLKNYVSIYLPGQRLITYQSLTELAEELPQPPFYRVHRSYIISIDKVNMVDGNTVYIGEKEIPVGETYRDGFLSMVREKHKV
ncbi:DNA-binding LytR/AlgR family response regulator [Pontibacter aydingkolensis]|uniref:LytTR family DNA-binding domain-containing protein n=1 Tax=Pontibacter aydingkolensis TaxID=1911536 RepID=A0ABS7CTW9_9BACT|nr:LytTR family DNA-binding domain-containing protein [Pontibacter aydingkolensis]MBW7467299.1 LytTR family DNA-binding domain-containing protein [Pontibacter aydingkolensis]